MQNPWLCVDCFEDEEQDGVYMGVFNRSPAEIAASLRRPATPSLEKIQMAYNDMNTCVSQRESFENSNSGFFCPKTLVSVF